MNRAQPFTTLLPTFTIRATFAALFVGVLVIAATIALPTYQVHKNSQQAISECGFGNISSVTRYEFECKAVGVSNELITNVERS